MTQPKPTRRARAERRSQIVDAARRLLLEQSFENVGMAEVAAAGDVSRPSVYRYFRGGRTEVLVAVAEDIVAEVRERLRHAAQGPFSTPKRMEHLLATLFGFFTTTPTAYRVLFQDVAGTGDPGVIGKVAGARAGLATEIADVVASDIHGDADDVLLTSTGILGAALANLELVLAGTVDAESAWRVTCSLAVSCLR